MLHWISSLSVVYIIACLACANLLPWQIAEYKHHPRYTLDWFHRELTHWGRVTHICFGNLTIIGSDNGLSPGRRQAIIWTSAGILLIGPLGTNFSEVLIGIHTFSLKKMHLKMSSAKWRPFCLVLNVLSNVKYWNKSTVSFITELNPLTLT